MRRLKPPPQRLVNKLLLYIRTKEVAVAVEAVTEGEVVVVLPVVVGRLVLAIIVVLLDIFAAIAENYKLHRQLLVHEPHLLMLCLRACLWTKSSSSSDLVPQLSESTSSDPVLVYSPPMVSHPVISPTSSLDIAPIVNSPSEPVSPVEDPPVEQVPPVADPLTETNTAEQPIALRCSNFTCLNRKNSAWCGTVPGKREKSGGSSRFLVVVLSSWTVGEVTDVQSSPAKSR
ncbi:hypothetical protein NL676_035300 [Syzygium grande]|nr:hypothetical protein NL676_035300 [Syzygium grande]